MREMRRALLVLVPLIALCPVAAHAQYKVLHDVQGSAGGLGTSCWSLFFHHNLRSISYRIRVSFLFAAVAVAIA